MRYIEYRRTHTVHIILYTQQNVLHPQININIKVMHNYNYGEIGQCYIHLHRPHTRTHADKYYYEFMAVLVCVERYEELDLFY